MSTGLQHTSWIVDLHPPRGLWLLLIVLPLIALLAFLGYQTTQVLPRIALVPGYSLPDQTGEQLTNEMMRGNLVIYAFPEAACAAPCPDTVQLLQEMAQEQNTTQRADLPLHIVIVSTYAEGTAAINAAVQEADVKGAQWHFVSDDSDHFRTMRQAEAQNNRASSDNEPFLALVDGWGIVRALYTTPDPSRIKHELRLVTHEARNSSGVNRYAYEAVHLFMCHNDLKATTYSQP